ncbi:MAG: neutral/alkaline non-lysosomal ceramidase N-terminal domain-containing protein, partial [Candidatus Latescibacteria bacterium]|nr:neutral/alkaline non-lysosomal ceramidase N-terminal domain-containing protein [Candidatus Latescibacterota bacterium]
GPDLVGKIRDLVQQQAGIPPTQLLLNSSHTHFGPGTILFRGMGTRDEAYLDVLVRQIVGAVRMAVDRLAPARLGVGRGSVRIGINRREKRPDGVILGKNPEGKVAPYVDVLRVDRGDGSLLALLFAHATHPVTLGGKCLLVTADFPGYAMRFVERWMLEGGVALFAQGCCGDVNPEIVGGTFSDVERSGTALGAAVVGTAAQITTSEEIELRVATRQLTLPLQDPPPIEEAERILEEYQKKLDESKTTGKEWGWVRHDLGMVEWAQDVLHLSRRGTMGLTQEFTIQGIRMNDTAIVAMDGEVFVDYALDFDARSLFRQTIVLGYSNGCIGYIPTEEAYAEGGYEVDSAYRYYGTLMIAMESDRMIREAAMDLLQELREGEIYRNRGTRIGGSSEMEKEKGRVVRCVSS